PQIEIEDALELPRRRERDDLAAVLETASLNDAMKYLGRQPRDDVREPGRFQDARQQLCFHGAAKSTGASPSAVVCFSLAKRHIIMWGRKTDRKSTRLNSSH